MGQFDTSVFYKVNQGTDYQDMARSAAGTQQITLQNKALAQKQALDALDFKRKDAVRSVIKDTYNKYGKIDLNDPNHTKAIIDADPEYGLGFLTKFYTQQTEQTNARFRQDSEATNKQAMQDAQQQDGGVQPQVEKQPYQYAATLPEGRQLAQAQEPVDPELTAQLEKERAVQEGLFGQENLNNPAFRGFNPQQPQEEAPQPYYAPTPMTMAQVASQRDMLAKKYASQGVDTSGDYPSSLSPAYAGDTGTGFVPSMPPPEYQPGTMGQAIQGQTIAQPAIQSVAAQRGNRVSNRELLLRGSTSQDNPYGMANKFAADADNLMIRSEFKYSEDNPLLALRKQRQALAENKFDQKEIHDFTDKVNHLENKMAGAVRTSGLLYLRGQRGLNVIENAEIKKDPYILNLLNGEIQGLVKMTAAPTELQMKEGYSSINTELAKLNSWITSNPTEAEVPAIIEQYKLITQDMMSIDKKIITDNIGIQAASYDYIINKYPEIMERVINGVTTAVDVPAIGTKGAKEITTKNIRPDISPDSGTPPSAKKLTVGTISKGYRFKGGNPADKNSWEKVQ